MAADVTARLGLFLCDLLRPNVPEVTFLPEQGEGDIERPEGPFCVPLINEAVQVNPPAEVYLVTVHLALQTNANDTSPEQHGEMVRKIMGVLQDLRRAGAGHDETRQIFINGLYIVLVRPVLGDQADTTVIEVKVACQLRAPVL
jgi:hypothetical protein